MAAAKKVLFIVGSTRAGRIGLALTQWLAKECTSHASGAFEAEVVDLADWTLPMDDEAAVPQAVKDGVYGQPHTSAWSAKVSSASGYVFVLPQYNWGYPAALKNALDHLFWEWNGKAAIIVSYGARGGGKAGAQLREVVAGGLKMRVAATAPELTAGDSVRVSSWGPLVESPVFSGAETAAIKQATAELVALLLAPAVPHRTSHAS